MNVATELPEVPHNRLTTGQEEVLAVSDVIKSGRWAAGKVLAELESNLARTAGVAHAVGVGSGIGALRLSLLASDVGAGDAVAVPAYSCVALANAVLACGAKPIPVEVEPGTWNISVAALKATLEQHPRLKVAIAVHTFGAIAPIREIEELGLSVIEDCSHAFGRAPFGCQGRMAMLSLYATKLLGAGEGGMILTQDEILADWLRQARDYSDQAPMAWRLNDKMTDLEAAIARCQLARLPQSLSARAALAQRYSELLKPHAGEGGFELPLDQTGRVWYRYAVAVSGDAEETISRMRAFGINAARPVERWCEPDFPNSSAAFQHLVSLPLYPTLTAAEQDRVVSAFLASVLPMVHA